MNTIAQTIQEAERLRVSGHIYADGDAVGSVIGFCEAARRAGKDVQGTFTPIPVTKQFRHLDTQTLVAPEQMDLLPGDLCIVFDTATPDRLPKPIRERFVTGTLIVVDHHYTGEDFGTMRLVNSDASSAAEMAFGLVKALGWYVTPKAAQAFYTGVVSDSGRFSYSSTSADTLRVAAELVDLGANPQRAAEELFEKQEFPVMKLLATVMDRLGYDEKHSLVWSHANDGDLKEVGASWDDTHPFILDTVRLARDADTAVMFRTTRGQTKFSLRSRGEVNVANIAKAFGGGGHRNAAAARVPANITMRDLLPQIREMIAMQRRNR